MNHTVLISNGTLDDEPAPMYFETEELIEHIWAELAMQEPGEYLKIEIGTWEGGVSVAKKKDTLKSSNEELPTYARG